MKLYVTMSLVFIFLSCQNVKKTNENSNQFFDFDEIEYYHKDITEREWLEIGKKEVQSLDEIALFKILNDHYPTTVKDKNFIAELRKLYPTKSKIPKSKFQEIANIFSEKYHGDFAIAGCEPFYRDILVFKKDNEIIGISKICFHCGLHSTVGTKKNTEQLGQNGDYNKLAILLKI